MTEQEHTKTEIQIFTESKLEQIASKGAIENEADYDWMLMVQRECALQISAVEKSMDKHIKTAHQAHKALLATKNAAVDPIKAVKKVTSKLMGEYQDKCDARDLAEQQRAELEARKQLQAEAKRSAAELASDGNLAAAKSALQHAENMPAPIVDIESSRPKHDNTITRTTYSAKVVDEKLIPRSYLVPDMKMLNECARALKDKFKLPGCELVKETNTHTKKG